MLDIKWIRANHQEFDHLLAKRGIEPMYERIHKLDENRRRLINVIQQLQNARNVKSKNLGSLARSINIDTAKLEEFEVIKRDVEDINKKISELELALEDDKELIEIIENLPNLPDTDVPYGADETMNKLLRIVGEPIVNHKAKQHFELGANLGMMDFVQTAKISGSRFVTLSNNLAKLERALINFMLDLHTNEFGFLELSPPALVKDEAMYNVGQLPKFEHDSFATTNHYRLIPTAEVSLVNMVADKIIAREELPIRYVAYTPCFRSEAGSHGRDTRGMIRLHQFGKVELVSITTPDESKLEHEYIVNCAEEILKKLELPYRVMLLCSGDMGFSAKKTYDIEVWLPGQNQYREISSCSNCGDFQARRMKTRYKDFGSHDTIFVHTLNGSALPIGRTMVAILENYQNLDGSINIPDVLVPYMNGLTKIEKLD
jgi:seryl-tRNA synthetase